jgi:hypothetical protein
LPACAAATLNRENRARKEAGLDWKEGLDREEDASPSIETLIERILLRVLLLRLGAVPANSGEACGQRLD